MATMLLSCISCKHQNHPSVEVESTPFDKFEVFGELHNQFLTNANENFTPKDVDNLECAVDYIDEFNQMYLNSLDIPLDQKQMLSTALADTKEFVQTKVFVETLFDVSDTKSDSDGLLLDNNLIAFQNGSIDKFEFEKLNQITLALKDNYESKMSNAELKRLLESIKSEWLQQGYSDDSKYGNVLATTLAVSLASLEWWEDKPEAIGSSTKVVPVWVGADVGGAIVGSVVAGINSYALNGEVNWKSVGLGAAGGAITGSTGVVGKLGKWISNVF